MRDGVTVQQFNEAAGGQVVFHLHVHVIPRFDGIALKPPPADGKAGGARRARGKNPWCAGRVKAGRW